MAQFPANIDLSSLDGTNGFTLSGVASADYSGFSVASAGDVNGDGFADVIVGAYGADPRGADSGASYVVFGRASGFSANIDLSSLDGSDGFKLSGVAASDHSGWSVASAGDVNGDGFADVIVGAFSADPHGSASGASYVVFGKASGFAANLDLSSLDGSNGFKLSGVAAADYSGYSVASAGDVNGDGFADLIVGAPFADPHGSYSGASYVVFGHASGFAANLDLSSLDGSNGFKLSGVAASDRSGHSVASAGDVNGDGFADLIVGAFGSSFGASYVVFGHESGFSANIDLSSLDGSNGFKLSGEAAFDQSGFSVASAGDVNGDGFADLIVGAPHGRFSGASGASYVVFGRGAGFAANIDLSSLDGTNGFKLSGVAADDYSGYSVASAGDVNGDGFADVIVGAFGVDPHGLFSGASYVVFGKASGFAANIDLSSLDGSNGFKLNGVAAGDYSGWSVAAAGDVNGDGFADVIVGARNAAPHGSQSGASYVVFGRAPNSAVNRTGTSASQTLAGGAFDDTLSGLGGNDRLFGNGGNDTLNGNSGADTMEGGFGSDTYFVDNAGDTVSEAVLAGVDTVRTNLATYALGANVENLTFIGSANFAWTGNSLANSITGGAGNDTLSGGGGNDTLSGGGGNDTLNGNSGADTMEGSFGSDTYFVDNAGDTVSEAVLAGVDTVKTTLATYSLGANVENLTFIGFVNFTGTGNAAANIITGGGGNDTLAGAAGNDTLTGGGGNDTLNGNLGADTMAGGLGSDTYFVDNAGDLVTEAALAGADTVRTTLAAYTLGANVENLVFIGAGNFTGTGNGLANIINGGSGNDTLAGGAGNDQLHGGAGHDSFRFDSALNASTNVDHIFDFSSVDDKILLSHSVFTAAGGLGTLAPGAFFVGAAAHDGSDRIIYHSFTGALGYDPDGTGATAEIHFANLSAGLTLTSTNFLIV